MYFPQNNDDQKTLKKVKAEVLETDDKRKDEENSRFPSGYESQKPSTSDAKADHIGNDDTIEETLLCVICQEIMHNCIRYGPSGVSIIHLASCMI